MTREEAVNRFKGIRKSFSISIAQSKFYPSKAILDELCDMAIEALSREQKKYDSICDELVKLKSNLNLPIEAAMAYEKSIGIVKKYAKMGDLK